MPDESKPAAEESKPAKQKPVANGDVVQVALADGTFTEAEVLKAHKDGKLDLQFSHRGASVTITGSPYDEGGKPDSWKR